MVEIKFTVNGIPPNKQGPSIWSVEEQARRIISLRTSALESMYRQGLSDPIDSKILLELEIYASSESLDNIGDLDNLIGGVCDGLKAKPTNPGFEIHDLFSEPHTIDILPMEPIVYKDDSQIWRLQAFKEITTGENHYIVKIKTVRAQ